MDSCRNSCLPVPVAAPEKGRSRIFAELAGLLDRMFEPCAMLLICIILSLGSFSAAMVYSWRASEVLQRMAEIREDLDRQMEVNRELCRQTRAYVDSEMPKYDVSAELEDINGRIDFLVEYTRDTRKYVEWER